MATCPECKAQISDSAKECEYCGKKVIRGDELSSPPKKLTLWQKTVIVVSIFILIAIGLTYGNAENREDQAAEDVFMNPVTEMVMAEAEKSGLASAYGIPEITLNAGTKQAIVFVVFPRGVMSQPVAAQFALRICEGLARAYVNQGYMPRGLAINVSSLTQNGAQIHYGNAVFNGNLDALGWIPASGR